MKTRLKPRNPFVACAKFRKAGPHDKPFKSQRRNGKLALHRTVKQSPEHWHKRTFIQGVYANASAGRPQYHRAVAERLKVSVCPTGISSGHKTEGE